MAELDARRTEVLGNAARIIQRRIRTYIARKDFLSMQEAATQLQALCRCIFSCPMKDLLIIFVFLSIFKEYIPFYSHLIVKKHCIHA